MVRMLMAANPQVRTASVAPRLDVRGQNQVRLSDIQRAELVQRHRDGAFKKELARVYGVHVETVRAIIRRHGGM